MPRKKRQQWRNKKAAVMRAAKKAKATKYEVLEPLTVSPESIVTKNDTKSKRSGNLSLTEIELDRKHAKKDLQTLQLAPRVYKKDNTYNQNDSGNRLIHWDSLESMIQSNTKCTHCGSTVCLKENTIGIATSVQLTCTNRRCCLNVTNKLNRTNYSEYNCRPNSNESFAINVQLVLSLLQMGGGSTEAGVLLTFLDLPNSQTFHTKTFTKIMTPIRPEIKKITDLCMQEARDEEIKETIGEELFERYKNGDLSSSEVQLVVMYDMGWNKRSSGHKYDSISGHGFLLGGNTRKIMNFRCMSKYCKKCFLAERTKKSRS